MVLQKPSLALMPSVTLKEITKCTERDSWTMKLDLWFQTTGHYLGKNALQNSVRID